MREWLLWHISANVGQQSCWDRFDCNIIKYSIRQLEKSFLYLSTGSVHWEVCTQIFSVVLDCFYNLHLPLICQSNQRALLKAGGVCNSCNQLILSRQS